MSPSTSVFSRCRFFAGRHRRRTLGSLAGSAHSLPNPEAIECRSCACTSSKQMGEKRDEEIRCACLQSTDMIPGTHDPSASKTLQLTCRFRRGWPISISDVT
ncbi:hypothetical protein A0H81_12157 [Grifola frondosa]|uniref:Uncharacterized protein n=1 Tax=Grifola frondosa TaxID=5627 RepID=A0A1C7LSU1_GRIFR|nr:hypothetical protein A0H81_12157 [Grifola frondosa]